VNDLRLHDRLADLADDLAPDADPWTQAAGARALHHRQRRTRLGVAGAAVAVALVAVGVPTAIGTLSAPDRGEVATPTSALPTEGPEGAAEELRQQVDGIRAHLESFEVDGSVADVSDDLPCPGAIDRISMATGMVIHGELGEVTGVADGCLWSTSPDPADSSVPAADRLDALAYAEPLTTAEDVVSRLTADVLERDCRWTGELVSGSFATLQLCEDEEQTTSTLTVVDGDGTGAWVLRAEVGAHMPEQFGLAAGTIAGLLYGVHQLQFVDPEQAVD
jgi:hypothetical protein